MEPARSPKRLRVGVLAGSASIEAWASVLTDTQVELVPKTDLSGLLAACPDLILAFTDPDDGARIASEVAASADPPPLTLLVGRDGHPNPHMRLLLTVLQAKREWQGTFDAIVDALMLLDAEGYVARANLALAQGVNRPFQKVVGVHYSALLGTSALGSGDPIALSLKDGAARTAEARYATLPGTQQVTTSPLGRGLVVILKDITKQKEQEEGLFRAARLADIGQLAAGVAHEISTPLTSIGLRAESLLRSAEDPSLQKIAAFKNFCHYLRSIEQEVFRCKKIISGLLDFSRLRMPEVHEMDLNALVEKAADLLRHQAKLKQVTLNLHLAPDLPQLRADVGQMQQVLIALLMNALDATTPPGQVVMETRSGPDTNQVTLSVEDDGKGIPPEDLDKIFNPFFTTKPLGEGTGLGLAICHGIVTSHGGDIRVESESGRGTRISLVLPLEGGARKTAAATESH